MEADSTAAAPVFRPASAVGLAPLVAHRAPDGTVILGHIGTGRFVEADDDVLLATHLIRAHRTLGAAEAAWPASRGEAPDMAGLCEDLHERGFVTRVDGIETPAAKEAVFPTIRPRFVWVRHPATLAALLALSLLGILLVALLPGVTRPTYTDLALTRISGLNLLLGFAGFFVTAFVHELGHYSAARAYGIHARISLGHRLAFPVLQTDVTNSWLLPRRARFLIFSAGILVNLSLAGVALALLALQQAGLVHVAPEPALRYAAALNVLLLPFQFLIWARTDLYYAFAAALGERNLSSDSMRYAGWRLARRVRPAALAVGNALRRLRHGPGFRYAPPAAPPDETWGNVPARRRALLASFAALTALGTVLMTLFLVSILHRLLLASLPRQLGLLRDAAQAGDAMGILSPVLTITVNALQLALIIVVPLHSAGAQAFRRGKARGAPA